MLIVKCTILLWVLFFVFRFLAKVTLSSENKVSISLTGKLKKMHFVLVLLLLDTILAIIGTVVSVVWLLFFM